MKYDVYVWFAGEWRFFGVWTKSEYEAIQKQHPDHDFEAMGW